LKNFNRRKFISAAATTSAFAWSSTVLPLAGHAASGLPVNLNKEKQTWLEINKETYGAKADHNGPIGGAKGYTKIVTKGDYTVNSLDSLLDALSKAKEGQTIFIPSGIELDLTARIYIEKLVLKIPEGVTLAGDRGYNGSLGALLTSDTLDTPMMIQAMGPNVRITGLRMRGPHAKRYMDHHARAFGPGGEGHTYYYKFPLSAGISTKYSGLEVDNCDLSAFARCGISLSRGEGHHIHHNFIHQCQYNGLGYGVSHDICASLIEYNLFNENRHSLAGTGKPGCNYTARHNVELGISLSHCFDMHGGRDRKDQTDIAGSSIEIYNNTFYAPQKAVVIRGVPEKVCDVHHNWFQLHEHAADALRASDKTIVHQNVYGTSPVKAE